MKLLLPKQSTVEEITSKTWEDIKLLDDCILEEERIIIKELKEKIERENKNLCPFLKREGNYFFYCAKNLTEEELKDNKLEPHNPKYANHVGVIEIQLYCINRHEACFYFQEKLL